MKRKNSWSPEELDIVGQYARTKASTYDVNLLLKRDGFKRSFSAVKSRIEAEGLSKRRYIEEHEKERSIGYLDIETTGVDDARFQYMVSWAIKRRDEKSVASDVIKRREILSYQTDRRICQSLVNEIQKYDKLVTYYGTRFDIPFIRTRSSLHKIDFPQFQSKTHTDLYFTIRNKFHLQRNTLANACQVFEIPGKDHVIPHVWVKGRLGHKESLDKILDHNIRDVIVLEKLHNRIELYRGNTKTSI